MFYKLISCGKIIKQKYEYCNTFNTLNMGKETKIFDKHVVDNFY